MDVSEGFIPIEQWKPDGFKIATILAEILGRRDGCVYEVVPAPTKNGVAHAVQEQPITKPSA